jgi:hypothetical protein
MKKQVKFTEEAILIATSRYSAVFLTEGDEEICGDCAINHINLLVDVRELDCSIFCCPWCGKDVIPADQDFYYDFKMQGYPEGFPAFEREASSGDYCIKCFDEAVSINLLQSMIASPLIPFDVKRNNDLVCFSFDGTSTGTEDVLKARINANWLYFNVVTGG